MTLTKRQTEKAGRLYSLAMAAHADGVGMDDDEIRVMEVSRMRAEAALASLGFDKSELLTIRDCIDAVRNA